MGVIPDQIRDLSFARTRVTRVLRNSYGQAVGLYEILDVLCAYLGVSKD